MAPSPSKPEASGAVGFLDLPPEIRNRIYELVLVVQSDGRIVFMPRLRPGLGKIQRGFLADTLYSSRQWHPSGSESIGLAPSLLATCKQVHQEALPVLYGNNSFLIAADKDNIKYPRRDGKIQFPRTVQAMRIVELHGGQNQFVVRSLLLVLQNMLDLDTLRIDIRLRRNFIVPHTMAKGLLPLVQNIHAERVGTDRKQVMDVIKFTGSASWWAEYRKPGFDKQVQQILRSNLGLE